MSELIETSSVLGIKIDAHTTKLFLFDIVNGKYHLLATSESDSTHKEPYNDLREGLFKAIDQLQRITGRYLLDNEMNLIIPSQPDGNGVDQIAISFGFLDSVSIITAGLLDSVSIESLSKVIQSTHLKHLDQISLNDSRKMDEILTSVINNRPDMIMISGGTENGANKSVLRMVDIILFCIKHLPKEKFPELIYAGNSTISNKVQEMVSNLINLTISDNIRPTIENENLRPALNSLNEINNQILQKKIHGFDFISLVARSTPVPYSQSIGTMTNFLSKLSSEKNSNILVIDLNQETIIIAGSNQGNLKLNVGKNSFQNDPDKYLAETDIKSIIQWLNKEIDSEDVNNYIWAKSIRPDTIPVDDKELAIELSMLNALVRKSYQNFQRETGFSQEIFSQIVINGDYFSKYENPSELTLILLDSIQPKGITNLFLDQHGILPILGSIAVDNPLLPIQILEGQAITLLAKVFSVQSKAKNDTPILKIKIEYKDGTFLEEQIIKGSITKLPVTPGQFVKIFFDPIGNIDLSQFGKNIEKGLVVQGGLCGVIFDTRTRPISLPKKTSERIDLIKKWRKNLNL
ncbi:MAG: glutamate mutase L [Anaerolineaceae bacterium]|nr:glutamate mutase L [Anaerolineaceae bacterium]